MFNGPSGWRAAEDDLYKGLVLSVECDKHPDDARAKLEEIIGTATAIVRSGGQWVDPADGLPQDKLHLHWRLAKPAMTGALDKLKHARQLATAIVGGIPRIFRSYIACAGRAHGTARSPPGCAKSSARSDEEIDLEGAVAALEAAAALRDIARKNGRDREAETPTDPADWSELTGNIVAGRDLHHSITRLAAKYIRAGMSKGAAVNQILAG